MSAESLDNIANEMLATTKTLTNSLRKQYAELKEDNRLPWIEQQLSSPRIIAQIKMASLEMQLAKTNISQNSYASGAMVNISVQIVNVC